MATNKNRGDKYLAHAFWGKHVAIREWLTKTEVNHTGTVICLLVGGFALKFNSSYWKWAYLASTGIVSVPWLLLKLWQAGARILFQLRRNDIGR